MVVPDTECPGAGGWPEIRALKELSVSVLEMLRHALAIAQSVAFTMRQLRICRSVRCGRQGEVIFLYDVAGMMRSTSSGSRSLAKAARRFADEVGPGAFRSGGWANVQSTRWQCTPNLQAFFPAGISPLLTDPATPGWIVPSGAKVAEKLPRRCGCENMQSARRHDMP